MPIEGGQRGELEPGTILVAKYKGAEHTAEVIAGEEGKAAYRLADGREFKSPSAAGKAVMGGTACNGWRFWSVQGAATPKESKPAARAKKVKAAADAEKSSE